MIAYPWRSELNSQPEVTAQGEAVVKLVSETSAMRATTANVDGTGHGDNEIPSLPESLSSLTNMIASSDADLPDGKETGVLSGLSGAERSEALVGLILQELNEDKAEEIVTINLANKSEIADAMVIASGRSQRHVGAIADQVMRKLKQSGVRNVRCEGVPACDWVLIDAGDAIIHLFRPEVRAFYNLERIWSETAHATSIEHNAKVTEQASS